ncbi:hypothetical protein LEP1GSC132_4237 [Leptospira kirschneri str. 200803703]|uniref:Uncharacterized protein n=1 Tax=Leptospira kirschneri serovar Pomona TaxID=561005 RepID=A0A1T1E3H8_9LEPT|nr:hypothetical protein [Leptospira kirschneri]EKP04568.1 hypothetical protein LEP1GSC018_2505 [Leptospira kirschneri str. 2008720114]EMJ86171.1 hypothetical protein LEP1GSC198_3486 [Leptospira kirschneri str. JB]EMN24584.1 hypothetical protein LEP1GSC065_3446 [Leptospira kirschneri serovar Sokoine str. RM1]EMO68417.1 hypothetical protein LEP1GSC132_4237 [Leptospira kirschneri str. 200803703]EMO81655.1 hypothetical protein LEP1GSC126_0607 [Leptospira kirschneri str. 200801774]
MDPVKDSRFFFDLKRKFEVILEEVEKKTFDQKDEIRELESLWEEMFELAGKNDSPYFQIRLKNLKKQLETFVKSKGYEKQEFDRIYHQLGKMKRNDSVEFLDESLRNRLDRIAQKHYSPGDMISVATSKKGKHYITFRCGTIYFVTDWSSYTVLKDLDRRKNTVEYKGSVYRIFPSSFVYGPSEEEYRNENFLTMNLLVLKRESGLEFYRFDTLGEILQINEGTFLKGLKPMESSEMDKRIRSYFRKAGIRYYYIPV